MGFSQSQMEGKNSRARHSLAGHRRQRDPVVLLQPGNGSGVRAQAIRRDRHHAVSRPAPGTGLAGGREIFPSAFGVKAWRRQQPRASCRHVRSNERRRRLERGTGDSHSGQPGAASQRRARFSSTGFCRATASSIFRRRSAKPTKARRIRCASISRKTMSIPKAVASTASNMSIPNSGKR